MSPIVLAALISILPAPEILATGASAVEINHPLAGADLPTLTPPNVRGGAAASVGGLLSGGGAWFAFPHGGVSGGFNLSPFQDRFPDRALADAAKAGTLRPRVPLAVWGTIPVGGWRLGTSAVYGYLDDPTRLAGETFDRSRSHAFTGSIGAGRDFGGTALDASVALTNMSASVLRGSFVEPQTSTRLAFRSLTTGLVRIERRFDASRLTAFLRGGGGKGEVAGRHSSSWLARSGVSWMAPLPEYGGIELILGIAYEQWWGVVRRLDVELHQGARLPVLGPHVATIAAHEGVDIEKDGGTVFTRALRFGYRFERPNYALNALTDVEDFPDFILVGAELSF